MELSHLFSDCCQTSVQAEPDRVSGCLMEKWSAATTAAADSWWWCEFGRSRSSSVRPFCRSKSFILELQLSNQPTNLEYGAAADQLLIAVQINDACCVCVCVCRTADEPNCGTTGEGRGSRLLSRPRVFKPVQSPPDSDHGVALDEDDNNRIPAMEPNGGPILHRV